MKIYQVWVESWEDSYVVATFHDLDEATKCLGYCLGNAGKRPWSESEFVGGREYEIRETDTETFSEFLKREARQKKAHKAFFNRKPKAVKQVRCLPPDQCQDVIKTILKDHSVVDFSIQRRAVDTYAVAANPPISTTVMRHLQTNRDLKDVKFLFESLI
jgi:hypothetical protein